MNRHPGLLVSVRSVPEAEAAFEGGADLIDIKEPARGSLGRADQNTIAQIIGFINGRRPVSAAAGELSAEPDSPAMAGLDFVKWGLAGCGGGIDWRELLAARLGAGASPRTAIVGYADWQRAGAPPLHEVSAFAQSWPGAAFLLDTFEKNPAGRPRSLLDWVPIREIEAICHELQDAGLRVAVAGSLRVADIRALRVVGPDWFAVRGAACECGERGMAIASDRVRMLAMTVRGALALNHRASNGSAAKMR